MEGNCTLLHFPHFKMIFKKRKHRNHIPKKTKRVNRTNNDLTKDHVKNCKLSQATIRALEESDKIYNNLKNNSIKVKIYTLKEAFRKMKSW